MDSRQVGSIKQRKKIVQHRGRPKGHHGGGLRRGLEVLYLHLEASVPPFGPVEARRRDGGAIQ